MSCHYSHCNTKNLWCELTKLPVGFWPSFPSTRIVFTLRSRYVSLCGYLKNVCIYGWYALIANLSALLSRTHTNAITLAIDSAIVSAFEWVWKYIIPWKFTNVIFPFAFSQAWMQNCFTCATVLSTNTQWFLWCRWTRASMTWSSRGKVSRRIK